jgi:tetratricopeptide (TPR) repeat protein
VELDPLSPIAHFRLGEFLQEQGRKSAALQSFQEAVRLQPDFLAALRRSGALADELNQPAIAAPAYKRIIEVAPDERSAYLRLAEINEKHLKQRAAAEQLYQTFLNKFPTAPEVNLVRIRLGAKPAAAPRPAAPKAAQAKAAPARAEPAMAGAEPAPKPATPARPVEPYVDPATRYKNALGLLLSGNLDAAAPQFEILVRQDPNHANAHLSLGQIYSMKAETMPKARAHYTRFLQLRPDDPKAPEVRRWLERTR